MTWLRMTWLRATTSTARLSLVAISLAGGMYATGCGDDDVETSASGGGGGASATTSAAAQGGASTSSMSSSGAATTTTGAGAGTTTATGTGGAGGGGAGPASCGIGLPNNFAGNEVRVVAANLTSGNLQSYDGGEGVRILQGLAPDVILVQEMNFGNSSAPAMASLVNNICGQGQCRYIRGPQAQIPNGIITKLPILGCGSWTDPEVNNRTFVWARMDIPGDADLWGISVHLLSSGANNRDQEASALMGEIMNNIPSDDLIVLGGDFNTNSRSENAINTFGAVFDVAGPYPVDQANNGMTNAPRNAPYDWVLADQQLTNFEIPVVIGANSFTRGAVIDTRVYTPLADLAPALFADSDAVSMQHMAVVKDFEFPAQ